MFYLTSSKEAKCHTLNCRQGRSCKVVSYIQQQENSAQNPRARVIVEKLSFKLWSTSGWAIGVKVGWNQCLCPPPSPNYHAPACNLPWLKCFSTALIFRVSFTNSARTRVLVYHPSLMSPFSRWSGNSPTHYQLLCHTPVHLFSLVGETSN